MDPKPPREVEWLELLEPLLEEDEPPELLECQSEDDDERLDDEPPQYQECEPVLWWEPEELEG